jgi:hypothetical protein
MDIQNDELLYFRKTLNDNNVRYIMAGGVATQNKKVINRPKDQVDVIELEKIRKIREENGRMIQTNVICLLSGNLIQNRPTIPTPF